MSATPGPIPLREVIVYVRCHQGACCSEAAHRGACLSAIELSPRISNDEPAERVRALLRSVDPRLDTRGIQIWILEQLQALGVPISCGVGGHPVDVGHLTLRFSNEATWQ